MCFFFNIILQIWLVRSLVGQRQSNNRKNCQKKNQKKRKLKFSTLLLNPLKKIGSNKFFPFNSLSKIDLGRVGILCPKPACISIKKE